MAQGMIDNTRKESTLAQGERKNNGPRERESDGKREKGSVEGREQWQRGKRNGRGEKLIAHGERKQGERGGQGERESERKMEDEKQ